MKKFESLPGTEFSSKSARGKIRRVLGLDPGLASTGFGIVDYRQGRYRMVSYGTIETSSSVPHQMRLLALYNRLCAVIDEFLPTEGAIEKLYFARNTSSAMNVSEARGVLSLCLAQHDISFGEYTPNQIKQAVTGTARADKELVEKYVKVLLALETEPKPDHAADALASAITHLHFTSL